MRRIPILLLTAGMLLTACAAAAEPTDVTDIAAGLGDGGGSKADFEAASSQGTDDSEVRIRFDVVDGRSVIRRASLELHASNTRRAYDDIIAMVEAAGGFVADATVYPTSGDDEQPTVSMTLRVPVEQLNATMAAIKDSVDEVVSESQGAEDVTDQFIDLDARLTNLQALETELRALLTEVRERESADPQKILAVFNELSSVRGQIEQIQGQLDYLEDRTELATLEVQLTQTPSAVPIVDQPWAPGEVARNALRDLVTGLQGATDWVINFAIFLLPMLLITVGPLAVVLVLVYRRFFRKTAAVTPAES